MFNVSLTHGGGGMQNGFDDFYVGPQSDEHESFRDEWDDAMDGWEDDDEPDDGFRGDVEADADALASAGYGTDEDYGYCGEDSYLDAYYEDRYDYGDAF
jgi:hypothetical protein